MPTAYAYVRYSSAIQADGDSIERQTTPLALFTKRFGVEIAQTFIDEGVSSFKGDNIKRGRFRDILEMIESGEIRPGSFLVIESIDRISRQQMDETATQLYEILKKGINIYTTADERLYSIKDKKKDLENYMMIGLIAKRANEESEMKSRRRKSAWRRAKRAVKEDNKIFNTSNNTPYGLRVVDGKFEIVEEEAKEIRDIFDRLKYQGVLTTIREVNKYSKRKWANRTVHMMLESKYVIGVYRSQRRENGKKVFEENIEGYYPEIISAKDYYEAVGAMKKRASKTHYGNESTGSLNIFKHCIKCDKCGQSMRFYRGKNSQGKQFAYVACETKKEFGSQKCKEQVFRFDYAVGTLLKYLRGMYYQHLEGLEYAPSLGNTDHLPSDENTRILEQNLPTQTPPESLQKADGLFLDMMRRVETGNVSEVENKQRELAQAKSKLANLIESVEAFGGKIPTHIMKSLGETEENVEVLEKELNTMEATKAESLDIIHFDEFLELLHRERGRQRINRFFKDGDYKFYFKYDKGFRTVYMAIKRNNEIVGRNGESFTLHHPLLRDFGIKNYNDLGVK
ncbi:recombinase family protein [Halovibrio sp. HP20-50]|uniref:recombinase family protein n=1 Tax=Halovibrio sp. HP20-59 TaxID=3080275 RepID=UPI00294B281F|nr:recombinase family protein [Halovibrio sp. HP20-59]MEA2117927.1 recombinase family protein [Halovibrio sp. HP20-59]